MSREGATLRLDIVSAARSEQGHPSMLGGTCYGATAVLPPTDALGAPLLRVDMPVLEAGQALCEVWHWNEPMTSGQQGNIHYRQSDTLLFGCLSLQETGTPEGDHPPLQGTTEAAYREIFDLLEAHGYHAVLRFWNYFPGINRESHAIERYRQFNIGRQDAFLSHGRSVIGNVPAACALGSAGGGLTIAFLAARAPVTGIENPRQLSAYHYPSQYGPRSPTFSRAGLVRLGGRDMLFISGTASIVGHQTLHAGDVAAQTRECLLNIEAVVGEANRLAPEAGFQLGQMAYTVYVRHRDDLPAVQRELAAFVGQPVSAVYLQADVCRSDLLVEIEASGGHAFHDEIAGER